MSIKSKDGSESYVGQVVKVYSKEERVMSDMWDTAFYAVVRVSGFYEVKSLGYRDFCQNNDVATVDAAPEEIAAYEAFVKAESEAAAKKRQEEADAKERITVNIGKMVEVVRGRKVAKGTIGQVFWMGQNQYGWTVGLRTSDKLDEKGRFADVVFVAKGNVEVV